MGKRTGSGTPGPDDSKRVTEPQGGAQKHKQVQESEPETVPIS